MNQAGVTATDRKVVPAARRVAELTGAPAAAIELPDGRIITGKTSDLLGAASAVLLNALKELAGIDHEKNIICTGISRADPASENCLPRKPQSETAYR